MRTRVIDHGPVYFSWCSLVPYPSRLRVLSASRTSTRSPTFAVTPVDERFMVALTRSRAAVRIASLGSRTLRTSRRFCFLCSTKLSRLVACAAPSSSGTRELRGVRGLRPNRSSKAVIFDCRDESGRVRLIQHAGATYSSQRPGQALQSSANISWSHPPNLSTAPWPREWSAGPKSSLAFSQWQRDFSISDRNSPPLSLRKFLGTPKVRHKFARILATSLVPLEGKGNANGNLEARSTTNSIYLLPVREVVPIERISTSRVSHGSTVRPGIVAIFWLRDRFRRLHPQGAT